MSAKYNYRGLFDIIIEELKQQYPSGIISHANEKKSDIFETSIEDVIKKSIEMWNQRCTTAQRIEATVEYHGGTRFPDYSINNITMEEKIGIEVKYHDSNNTWATKGNSAVATTQVPGLSEIYVLFGHFKRIPPEFKILPMSRCIEKIETTHNPRYALNMEADCDFCVDKLGISYDNLRNLDEHHREAIVKAYIATEELTTLSEYQHRSSLLAQCFILFPELFSNSQTKYKRMGEWVFANGIYCRNARDAISSKGQVEIPIDNNPLFNGIKYPRIFYNLFLLKSEIKEQLTTLPVQVIEKYWRQAVSDDCDERFNSWRELISEQFGGATKEVAATGNKFIDVIDGIFNS